MDATISLFVLPSADFLWNLLLPQAQPKIN
jgi:hypothetical protein